MSLFALLAALLLEQFHPLSARRYLFGWLSGYVQFFQHRFNAGEHRHGKIAWMLAVLPLIAGTVVTYQLLYDIHLLLAWLFNVLMLYLTMGFRQFSHYFTDIQQALRDDKLDEARQLLSQWRGISAQELDTEQVARLTMEEALLASHRNVFGVIVWFVLFSAIGLGGAAGALLYRLAQFLRKYWNDDGSQLGQFGDFARQIFNLLEWLPIRITALIFAIVGDFEDTIYCWQTQAASWPDKAAGILLASGAGALGVRLGMPIPQDGVLLDRAELGVGEEADTSFLQSTVGLVWRSVVFWLALLFLLTLTNWLN